MAVGPLANMPDLFPRSTLADPKGFKTVIQEPGYFPPAHTSGWRTSILRPYTVTYSYDAILTRKSQHNEEDEQEIYGSAEMEVKVHRLAYMPPSRLSGWRTSTVPNYIVTYCWDFDSNVRSPDDENESTGGIESEVESQDNSEQERSSSGSTDMDLEQRNGKDEKKSDGSTHSEPEPQDNEEEEKSGSDSAQSPKELQEFKEKGKGRMGNPDSSIERHEPYRPTPIGPLEMLHINRNLGRLDPARLRRAVRYLVEQPGLVTVSGTPLVIYASTLTLSKIHDLIIEWQFED